MLRSRSTPRQQRACFVGSDPIRETDRSPTSVSRPISVSTSPNAAPIAGFRQPYRFLAVPRPFGGRLRERRRDSRCAGLRVASASIWVIAALRSRMLSRNPVLVRIALRQQVTALAGFGVDHPAAQLIDDRRASSAWSRASRPAS